MRWLGPLVLSLFVGVFPAYSAVYQLTVSGHLGADPPEALDFDDQLGLFPPVDIYYLDQPFSATILLNDSVPGAQYSISAAGGSATGGPEYGVKSASPLTASITINGASFDLDLTGQGRNSGTAVLNLDPTAGTGLKLLLVVNHHEPYHFDDGRESGGVDNNLKFDLELPDTTHVSDFLGPFSTDIVPDNRYPGNRNGSFYFQTISAYSDGDGHYGFGPNTTYGYFVADHLTFGPAVPEVATWIMMIGGLGFTGAAMRRRRNVHVTVA